MTDGQRDGREYRQMDGQRQLQYPWDDDILIYALMILIQYVWNERSSY